MSVIGTLNTKPSFKSLMVAVVILSLKPVLARDYSGEIICSSVEVSWDGICRMDDSAWSICHDTYDARLPTWPYQICCYHGSEEFLNLA